MVTNFYTMSKGRLTPLQDVKPNLGRFVTVMKGRCRSKMRADTLAAPALSVGRGEEQSDQSVTFTPITKRRPIVSNIIVLVCIALLPSVPQ